MTASTWACPRLPPPVLAPRRKTRQIKVGKVLVGGDAPVSVQSMTTTLTSDVNTTLQQIAELDRGRLRHRPGGLPVPGRRRRAAGDRPALADPGDRRHPLPAQVRLRRDRRRLRGSPGEPGQHPQVRRPGQGDRRAPPRTAASRSGSASTPARWTRGCWRSTARRRPRRWSSRRSGRRRCSRSTTSTTSRSRSSTTTRSSWCGPTSCSSEARRLAAAPRRHRGGAGVPGHDQVVGRVRRAAVQGHRRHDPGLAVRAAGRGGQGRPPDPPVAQPAERKLEIVSCPSCGRAQVDVYTLADEVTAGSRAWRCRCGSR